MVQKPLTSKSTMRSLKPIIFYRLTLLLNNHVLMSYLSGIYLESWFSWLRDGAQKTLKKRTNTMKNTMKVKWQQ